MFKVEWSGKYPSLCCGNWYIYKNGVDVSDKIPEDLRDSEMGTFGVYSSWYFDEDYREVFEDYENGLDCGEWIKENDWIHSICDNLDECNELYYAINAEDWRHGSCGGCI